MSDPESLAAQVSELTIQLNQKDQDLLLAAEYGNLLLQQHASMSEELNRCKNELATLKQSSDVTQQQNRALRKNIKVLEAMQNTMQKNTEIADVAMAMEKDGSELRRKNSLDELEGLRARIDQTLNVQRNLQQENERQLKIIKTLEQQKSTAEQKAGDLDRNHEKSLQQLQKKLAKTSNALDKMRRMCKEAEKENNAKAIELEHSEQFEKELENEFEMELDTMRAENDSLKLELKMHRNKARLQDHVLSPKRTIASTTWDSPSVFEEVTSRSHLFDEMNLMHKSSSDVMYEYFNLSVSSVKLKFKVMDAVIGLDPEQLYKRAMQESVPYYQWHEWLVDIVNAWCEITQFTSQHSPSQLDATRDAPATYKLVSATPRSEDKSKSVPVLEQ